MTIDCWISDAAAKWPDKPALIFGETVIGYAAMAALIDRRAAGLAKAGLSRGDRVGWLGMNNPEVLVLLFACARIGAMLLPFNWRLAAAELAEIAADCAPRMIFHDAHLATQRRVWRGRTPPPYQHPSRTRSGTSPCPQNHRITPRVRSAKTIRFWLSIPRARQVRQKARS